MSQPLFPDPFEDHVTHKTRTPPSHGYLETPPEMALGKTRWYMQVPPERAGETFKMGGPAPWGSDGVVWVFSLGRDGLNPDGSFAYPVLVKNGVFLVWNVFLPGVGTKYEVAPRDLNTGDLVTMTSWSHANGDSVITALLTPPENLINLSTVVVSTNTSAVTDLFCMSLVFNVHK